MSRKLIVVGNGLGMAIAPKQFALKPVMQRVWRVGLEEDERKLLAKNFRDIDEDNGPSEERHLMVAQVAVMMPELIGHMEISHATDLKKWFSDPPQLGTLKSALNKYTYLIAKDLFKASRKILETRNKGSDEIKLFKSWKSALIATYHNDLKPHLATLNYDSFLYNEEFWSFTCDGWAGKSCVHRFSYFESVAPRNIQLHGSPLFWEKHKENVDKLNRNEIEDKPDTPCFTPHIILSDGVLKPLLIARSEVLSKYWEELQNILLNDKPEEIILFGYGGGDDHLNRLIGESKCPVRVVEWCDDHSIPDREQEWKKWLGDDTNVIVDLRKNILTFDEWDNRPPASKMEDDA